jgi:hypothetical protein
MVKLGLTFAFGAALLVTSQVFEITVSEAHARAECAARSHAARGPSRRNKDRALKGAIGNWESEARKRYGMRFNDWGKSINRNTSNCKSNGREFSCVVSAVACAKAPLRERAQPFGHPQIDGAATR